MEKERGSDETVEDKGGQGNALGRNQSRPCIDCRPSQALRKERNGECVSMSLRDR